jgi:single-strand DNA-binding protein
LTSNSWTISGNHARDPELRNLPSGQSVCSIRIAHNERLQGWRAGERTDHAAYFDVTIWRGLGEWISKNVASGDKVVGAGRLRWREWETTQGDKRQAVDISADSVVPVPRRADTPATSERRSQRDAARRPAHRGQATSQPSDRQATEATHAHTHHQHSACAAARGAPGRPARPARHDRQHDRP